MYSSKNPEKCQFFYTLANFDPLITKLKKNPKSFHRKIGKSGKKIRTFHRESMKNMLPYDIIVCPTSFEWNFVTKPFPTGSICPYGTICANGWIWCTSSQSNKTEATKVNSNSHFSLELFQIKQFFNELQSQWLFSILNFKYNGFN